jgi:hypothetical protein
LPKRRSGGEELLKRTRESVENLPGLDLVEEQNSKHSFGFGILHPTSSNLISSGKQKVIDGFSHAKGHASKLEGRREAGFLLLQQQPSFSNLIK